MRSLISLVACLVTAGTLPAQQPNCNAPVSAPACASVVSPANCNCRQPCPTCQPPCRTPPESEEEKHPGNPEGLLQSGFFQAPPRNGVVRGAINRLGIEGPALTFPAMTLRLPNLELPSWFRSRSNARMFIEAAEAPYTEMGYASAYGAQGLTAETAPNRESSQRETNLDDCERKLRELQEKYEQIRLEADKLQQLKECIEAYQRNEKMGASGQSRPYGSPQQKGEPFDARGAAPPSPPQPTPDNGAMRRLHAPPFVQPQSEQPQYVPQPSEPVRYVERPVTYIAEPQPLREPQRLPIREPQRPSARIIGVR